MGPPIGGGYGECAPGFLKVCPEMDGTRPMDSMPVCPAPMTMPMGRSLDRMVGQMGSSDGCECVPMVLMQMVMTQQMVGMRADTRGVEVFEDESVKVGKKTCICSFSFTMAGNKVKKALGTCDKKCSGNVKKLSLNNDDWSFTFGFGVKKGKVKMGKVTAVGGSTGGGSGGSGSGGQEVRECLEAQGCQEVPECQEDTATQDVSASICPATWEVLECPQCHQPGLDQELDLVDLVPHLFLPRVETEQVTNTSILVASPTPGTLPIHPFVQEPLSPQDGSSLQHPAPTQTPLWCHLPQ